MGATPLLARGNSSGELLAQVEARRMVEPNQGQDPGQTLIQRRVRFSAEADGLSRNLKSQSTTLPELSRSLGRERRKPS